MNRNSQIVKLNVGGKRYETTITTLNYETDSFLSKLVVNHKQTIDEGKEIFIDRNGNYFEHILEYLRDPQTWVLSNNIDKNIIKTEVNFYGLTNLLTILNTNSKYDIYTSFDIVSYDNAFDLTIIDMVIASDFKFADIENRGIENLCRTVNNYINKFDRIGYQFVSAISSVKNRTIYLFKAK